MTVKPQEPGRSAGYVRGRVHSAAGAIAGAKLVVRDNASREVIGETYTTREGEFVVPVRTELPGAKPVRSASLDVYDARGALLASQGRVSVRPGRSTSKNVRVGADRVVGFQPSSPPLERLSGGIVDPQALDDLQRAAWHAFPRRQGAASLSGALGMCPLPPMARFEDMLDTAWDVLEGDPGAARRFRQTLDALAVPRDTPVSENLFRQMEISFSAMGTRSLAHAAGSAGEAASAYTIFRRQIPQPVPAHGHRCLLGPERFLPVAAAALHLSSTPLEAVRSLAAIEDGLCGLGRANELLTAGERVLRGGDPRAFRSLVHHWGHDCGPDDGPRPGPPLPSPGPECPPGFQPPHMDPCWVDRHHCLFEMIEAFSEARLFPTQAYTIDSITPDGVCPGDIVEIKGENFGDTPGAVQFTTIYGHTVAGDVRSWSDSSITVEAPAAAGSGPVHLKILDRVIRACHASIPIYRQGNEVSISVDNPAILTLLVDGRTAHICVEPGATFPVEWSASHDGVSLRLEDQNGQLVSELNGLSRNGTATLTAPNLDNEGDLRLIARVSSTCGEGERIRNIRVTVIPELTIEGVEFTQGVQRFWRDGIVPNSLPTIAGKDTIMRVYVSCNRSGFANDEVEITGIAHVDGSPLYPINGITPNDPTSDPFINARREDLIDRQETDHTLNFRIPADWCNGTQNVTVRVMTTEPFCEFPIERTLQTSRAWQNNPALRVRFVRIRDDSQNPSTPRPTADECRFSIERAFDMMPSPPTDIAPAWEPLWNTDRDFTNDDDALSGLLSDLDDQHNCSLWEWLWGWTGWTDCPDDDEAIWVGFSRDFNRGMAYRPGNTAISAIYRETMSAIGTLRIKTAHEIGHNLSMCHIDVGGAGNPCYDHPDDGQLQDVAFDPFWNQTVPAGTTDFMGYGSPRWSSADSWQRMINFI